MINWTADSIRTVVLDIIACRLDIKPEEIALKDALLEDLGAKSLDVLDIIASIEQRFEIAIPDDVLRTIRTTGDILVRLEQKLFGE